MFAKTARPVPLPRAAPTAAQIFSVPRLSGGYDYYKAPPGTTPPLGNDYPVPNVAHANPIGISSLHVGREMPPGCVKVGSGERAIGSVTAMPGAGGSIPGLGSLGEFTLKMPLETPPGFLWATGIVAATVAFWATLKMRRRR